MQKLRTREALPLYSVQRILDDALKIKVRRAKTQAKVQHADYKQRHPDEARDANNNDFTKLTTRITKEVKDRQTKALERRDKVARGQD